MTGLIALVGGDEFQPSCEDMDRAILKATGVERAKVVVLPTASEHYAEIAAGNGATHFSSLGADASPLMVVDSEATNDAELLSPVDTADIVYFAGGSPALLFERLSDSLLLSKLKETLERGAIVAGSSAGAMVMGSWMRFRQWSEVLGFVPGIVAMPHHERGDPASTSAELAASGHSDLTALGIDGATGCLGRPGEEWFVLGAGGITVYRGGQWQRFTAGDTFKV